MKKINPNDSKIEWDDHEEDRLLIKQPFLFIVLYLTFSLFEQLGF
ncbi:hypothetical protein [Metabacillus niabensis]|nr:hypothetical protein [Metabacillus niabensis]